MVTRNLVRLQQEVLQYSSLSPGSRPHVPYVLDFGKMITRPKKTGLKRGRLSLVRLLFFIGFFDQDINTLKGRLGLYIRIFDFTLAKKSTFL
jgi:hypothetical protein